MFPQSVSPPKTYVARLERGPGAALEIERPHVVHVARAARRPEVVTVAMRAGDFLQLDVTRAADVVGRELDVRVHVEDAAGRTACDTRRVSVVDRE